MLLFHQLNSELTVVKLKLSKKATKIDEIFTVDLTLCSKCQIDGEDFINFVAFLENTNFKRYENALRVIFDQWPKLYLGFDVESEIQILKVIYHLFTYS
jgi:hypothetical protein